MVRALVVFLTVWSLHHFPQRPQSGTQMSFPQKSNSNPFQMPWQVGKSRGFCVNVVIHLRTGDKRSVRGDSALLYFDWWKLISSAGVLGPILFTTWEQDWTEIWAVRGWGFACERHIFIKPQPNHHPIRLWSISITLQLPSSSSSSALVEGHDPGLRVEVELRCVWWLFPSWRERSEM